MPMQCTKSFRTANDCLFKTFFFPQKNHSSENRARMSFVSSIFKRNAQPKCPGTPTLKMRYHHSSFVQADPLESTELIYTRRVSGFRWGPNATWRNAKFNPITLSPRSLARISQILEDNWNLKLLRSSSTWEGDGADDSSESSCKSNY